MPARNRTIPRIRGVAAFMAACALLSCGRDADNPPAAEFIVAGGDSTYWVRTEGSNVRVRGTPMVLAQLDDRFRELYVVDDDHSFEKALFVGQRLYQRDILTGDSTEIFRDSLIPMMAERYERANPEARRLGPDEEPGQEPSITASAEVSVIGVHGPFLSLEYHADTTVGDDDTWHTTKHIVVDLRTGKRLSLAEVVGPDQATVAIKRGRELYQEALDSLRRDQRPVAQRALSALTAGRVRFDPMSFALAAPNGTLMVAFSAPGQGHGGEGFVMSMKPVAVVEPSWWRDARVALPSSTAENEEHWSRQGYTVKAYYESQDAPARLTLTDSTGHAFEIGRMSAPVHRIYWLDAPAITRPQREALTKAFDEAALYDDAARADRPGVPTIVAAVRR